MTAVEHGVVIGAHPGYADREGFGRRIIPMTPAEIGRLVIAQVGALAGIARLAGGDVRYVKPHGALANLAAADRTVADAIVSAVAATDPTLAFLAISGTQVEHAARAAGLTVFSEIFADRAYQPDGQLVPRREPGAVIHDPEVAADRLIKFIDSGRMEVVGAAPIHLDAHSICVHGDTPGAVAMAQHVRARLAGAGLDTRAFLAA
jgi:5-oxoprolinase (ATP-hydrolysing) subunit A